MKQKDTRLHLLFSKGKENELEYRTGPIHKVIKKMAT